MAQGLAIQASWVLITWRAAHFMWKRGLGHYQAVGGQGGILRDRRHQGHIVGRDSRMRREKSGVLSAASAASLIRERRRSSSKGNFLSTKPAR